MCMIFPSSTVAGHFQVELYPKGFFGDDFSVQPYQPFPRLFRLTNHARGKNSDALWGVDIQIVGVCVFLYLEV